ncbi:MAG: hypothetical protein IKJ73_03730 [Lachnospiraceae bacterium]|nr:hypothetical protein [Lachnospiraceae bacterium]
MGFDEIYSHQNRILVGTSEALNYLEVEIKNLRGVIVGISQSWSSQAGDRNILLKRLANVRKDLGKNIRKLRGFVLSSSHYLSQMKKFDRYDGLTFSGSCRVSDVAYSNSNSSTIKCNTKDVEGYVSAINASAKIIDTYSSDLHILINALDNNMVCAVGTWKSTLKKYAGRILYQGEILRSVATDLSQMMANYNNAEKKINKVIEDLKSGNITTLQLAEMINQQVQAGSNNFNVVGFTDGYKAGELRAENGKEYYENIDLLRQYITGEVDVGSGSNKYADWLNVLNYLSQTSKIKKGLEDGYQAEDAENFLDLLKDVVGDNINISSIKDLKTAKNAKEVRDILSKNGVTGIYADILLSYGCNFYTNIIDGIEQGLPMEDIAFRAGGVSVLDTFDDVVLSDTNTTIAYLPAKAVSNLIGYDLGTEAMRATGCDNEFDAVREAPKKLLNEIKKNATWDNWKSGMKLLGKEIKKLKFW